MKRAFLLALPLALSACSTLDLDPAELDDVAKTPATLEESLDALRQDHSFLLRGDVFTDDVIDTWIWYKTEHECEALRQRPHPFEFAMYYDI